MENVSSSNSHKDNLPTLRFNGFCNDWLTYSLSDIAEINPLTKELLPNSFYYIDLGSVVKGNLVNDIKMCKDQAPSRAQRLVNINDILFQTVRPYQQNNYIFTEERDLPTVASTGYAQIRTSEDPYFLYALLHTKDFLDKVLTRCTGSNYPAINSNDLGEITVAIPEKGEQQHIANFIKLLNCRINGQDKLVAALKSYKRGLLYAIFNGKIALTKNEQFDYERVKNLFELIPDKQFQIQTNEYKSKGDFDVVDQGKLNIVAHSNNKSRLFTDLPIIIFGDHTTNIKYRTKPFIVGGDGVKLLKCKQNNNSRYLYYALQHYNIRPEGYKRHYSILRNIELPILTNEVQNKIAFILEKIDSYIIKQTYMLESISNLKNAFLQKLFI